LSGAELGEELGEALVEEVLNEKKRIAAEIKELQGRIGKAYMPKKKKRKRTARAEQITNGEEQLGGGDAAGRPGMERSPSSEGSEQQEEYGGNAFMT